MIQTEVLASTHGQPGPVTKAVNETPEWPCRIDSAFYGIVRVNDPSF